MTSQLEGTFGYLGADLGGDGEAIDDLCGSFGFGQGGHARI